MARRADSGKAKQKALESTGFPALFRDAYARWRAALSPNDQRRAQIVMREKLLLADTKSIRNWMQGVSAPRSADAWAALRAILEEAPANAEHLPALDGAFDAVRSQRGEATAPVPSLAEAMPILETARAPAGAIWVVRDHERLDIDTSSAASDVEAAARPEVAARHESVKRKAATLAETLGHRFDNRRGWEAFRPAIEELRRVAECDTAELPSRIGELYDAMVSVASFIDQDNSIGKDPASLFEALPPDIRRAVTDLAATGAPFVRTFPSARATDDEAGAFLTRPEILTPARQLLAVTEEKSLITGAAAAHIRAELTTAERGGFQAQKAGNRALGTLRNLVSTAAWIMATVYLGAIGSQIQASGSLVAKRAGEAFVAAETAVVRLIEDMPADIRAAVDAVMQANKAGGARAGDDPLATAPPVDPLPGARFRPPLTPLARWRDPIPGLPEEAWPDMVTLPAGSFLMGAPKTEEDSAEDERPQRQVTVSQPFAIGRCAVTFAQWDAALAAEAKLRHPPDKDWGRGQRPVINVSWEDAQGYCAWLNQRLGLRPGTYRLPSEAEWEYACRAGTETPFSLGETITAAQANFGSGGRKDRRRTVPVGSLPANDWGLHEMHGNVWEWVEDVFGPYPVGPTDAVPLQHLGSLPRVLRGGSWHVDRKNLRSARRVRNAPGFRDSTFGFRLARTLPATTPAAETYSVTVGETQNGTVKWFNAEKGFGFLKPDGSDKDVFIHISELRKSGLQGLNDSARVSFAMVRDGQGHMSAGYIRLLEK